VIERYGWRVMGPGLTTGERIMGSARSLTGGGQRT